LPTTKNVPVTEVPPAEITHADEANRPPGVEEIEQAAESPLLNRVPARSVIVIVVPGGAEVDDKTSIG
jgi:hypothetical protein